MNNNLMTSILLENCTTFKERNEIRVLTESQATKVSNIMLSNLYKSAMEKGHIDFESILPSRGRISKYDGLENMLGSLNILDDVSNKNMIKVPEVRIIKDAIANVDACGDLFEKGYKFEKEIIMMTYASIVLACVEATSGVLSSYMDFIKRPDQTQFVVLDQKQKPHAELIRILEAFNNSVKSGEMRRTLTDVLGNEQKNFSGSVITVAVVLGGLTVIIPAIREIIFTFYHSRMKVSEYLKHQSMFVESHKVNVEMNSNIPPKKKQEILKRQQKMIDEMLKLSDKIKVDYATSSAKANAEMNGHNKRFTLNSVQSEVVSNDGGGFNLL